MMPCEGADAPPLAAAADAVGAGAQADATFIVQVCAPIGIRRRSLRTLRLRRDRCWSGGPGLMWLGFLRGGGSEGEGLGCLPGDASLLYISSEIVIGC